MAAGLARDGGAGQLTDELVGQVAEAVRPARPGGHGKPWDRLEACHTQIQAWVKQGPTVVKIGVLLERQGIAVPYRTLHRFCAERCGYGRTAATTMRVADGEPGVECQLDFGYLGLLADPVSGRQRKVYALIFTACKFVTAVAFSPDGIRLATGSGDKAVRIWSVAELSRDACGRGIRSGLIRRPSCRFVRADRHGQVPGVLLDRAPVEPAQRADSSCRRCRRGGEPP